MRIYLTLAAATLIAVVGVIVLAPTAESRTASTEVVNLFKNGNPTAVDGYTIPLGTVPVGKTWTIEYVSICAEKLRDGTELPWGGEFTVAVFIDGKPFSQSSTATGQRVNFQGQGSVGITLPAGTHLDLFVYLWHGVVDPLSRFFYGASVLIQEN